MSFLSACHPFTWPMVGADPKPFAPILTFAIEQLVYYSRSGLIFNNPTGILL